MVKTEYCPTNQSATILVSGDFVFSLQQDFRQAYESFPEVKSFTVDLGQTSYLDSSALGMLLAMANFVTKKGASLSVSNAKGHAAEVLRLAQIDKLISHYNGIASFNS